ncbi:SET and MYND domain-containing 4 [Hyphodiscus hymeniophilus]|uniref:SET and MYND domain-containing 4 n=1 Tax=Hyphodiscus hymeniophilus TaxID=353542 RepID=A0A9P6VJW0_9HELO|nr:SET and MYND domain-containing 4 [Hyphodiscus hymeniophilus]
MDIHDVSEIPQYMELLLKQKKSLQDAQLSKGRRPKEKKQPGELIMQFRFRLMTSRGGSRNLAHSIRSTFIPPAYTPCITPLSGLKKVMIGNLQLETHHRDTYIPLRSVTPPDRMTAVMAIVEDEKKDVLMLQLYYQPEESEHPAEEILPEGTVLIVKEPYLKVMADGDYGIRVDHLSDVTFDVRNLIPNQWQLNAEKGHTPASTSKLRGNDCFNKFQYFKAIEHSYSEGIICAEMAEEADTLKLNRSLAYLRTNQFDATLSDLELISATEKPTEKALVRKARALYNLHRYLECTEVYKVLCAEYPSSIASAELKRTISRVTEQETGKYQFKKLYTEATKIRPPHLDHATYIGPVEVRSSNSRGRGLFTTAEVKAGDLLLCEKAFAHAYYDSSKKDDSQMSLLIIAETDSMSMGTQVDLIGMIIRKLQRNPSLSPVITDLHHGSFLIQRIISLNCFGCPLSSRETYLDSMRDSAINEKKNVELYHSCGVWPKASYINHCCYSNARRSFIGDMMMVRASQDLAPNTEITFWYQAPHLDVYSDRQKKFRNWGFQCGCSMCQDDKKTDDKVIAQRNSLRAEAKKLYQSRRKLDTAKLEKVLASIASSYTQAPSKVPRLAIWDPLLAMAQIYTSQNHFTKVIESALGCLASLGYVIEGGKRSPPVIRKWGLMHDTLTECWMLTCVAYHSLHQQSSKVQAYEYAKISYRICVGEDETFEETHGKLADL